MKKLMYLTVSAPLGQREAFLISEMNCLVGQGVDLTIVPVNPAKQVFHRDGTSLLHRTIVTGLWSREVWLSALSCFIKAPLRVAALLFKIMKSGNPVNKMKNLLVFPKSLFIAEKVGLLQISHIHAHWASTPSTCAMVVSALTGVSWSFTAHRWDILNNNLVREKVKNSSFVRVISKKGRKQIINIAGSNEAKKVVYCPMGVEAPEELLERICRWRRKPFIAAVGSLTPVKGHRYLLLACRLLADRDMDFRCLIIGDGPERGNLSDLIDHLGLGKIVILTGALPHDSVLRMFRADTLRVLAHPSVETPAGEHEGVPVAVMEAIAHNIPVVVTETGSITDLVDRESGVIVPPEDPAALAWAISSLLNDPARARVLSKVARRRIKEKFSLKRNVSILMGRMGITP